MTGSSSKLLQIQGKWYRERKPKKNPKPEKKNKNYSTPLKLGYDPLARSAQGFAPTSRCDPRMDERMDMKTHRRRYHTTMHVYTYVRMESARTPISLGISNRRGLGTHLCLGWRPHPAHARRPLLEHPALIVDFPIKTSIYIHLSFISIEFSWIFNCHVCLPQNTGENIMASWMVAVTILGFRRPSGWGLCLQEAHDGNGQWGGDPVMKHGPVTVQRWYLCR